MNKEVMFSSGNECWGTPQDLFDKLNAEFGFTLDAAADESNHKCERYFTLNEDGLKQPWNGVVWCNPPYGRQIGKWVEKAHKSVSGGGKTKVVMLLPARTDTRWFHDFILDKAEIRFLRGRLKFGDAKNAAPFPSMIVIFSREERK